MLIRMNNVFSYSLSFSVNKNIRNGVGLSAYVKPLTLFYIFTCIIQCKIKPSKRHQSADTNLANFNWLSNPSESTSLFSYMT